MIGTEPATFVLTCSRGHKWGSEGTCVTTATCKRWPQPDKPRCTRGACAGHWKSMIVYVGRKRPGLVGEGRCG